MPVPSRWHPGEIAAQQARGYEDAAWGGYEGYLEGAPSFMATFLSSLPFLSITTLDQDGMPWASLLCNDGHMGFMELQQDEPTCTFKCTIQAAEGIPIRECLLRLKDELLKGIEPYDENGDARSQFQIAAVGVMLHNRRRNKMQGVIVNVEDVPMCREEGRFVFHIDVSNTFGNCPKYINTRHLIPSQDVSSPPSVSHGRDSQLPAEVLSILASADMLFLATKHSGSLDAYPVDLPQLGNNIRGGPPGFLRTYFDKETQKHVIILPDWSGNRLMQSFGNMTNDPVAGITIPVWNSKNGRKSDLLHITCDAHVLASEEASRLIRGVQGAVELRTRSWSLVHGGISLTELNNSIGWSPYNPPVRLLQSEKPSLSVKGTTRPTAILSSAHFWSPFLATFTFNVDTPLPFQPGQHIILDCYHLLDTRVQLYTHMAQFRGGEKDLNDDGTRSWTISYAPSMQQFEITLRRKERGGVTPSLFRRGWLLREEGFDSNEVKVEVLGLGGSSLLSLTELPQSDTLQLAYLVSGIGLTPMLPHLSQLIKSNIAQARVLAIAAVKWDEVGITRKLIRRALTRESNSRIKLNIRLYLLAGAMPNSVEAETEQEGEEIELSANITLEDVVIRGNRLQSNSLTTDVHLPIDNKSFQLPVEACNELISSSQVVVCAGTAFSKVARDALKLAGVSDDIIKMESFSF